MGDETFRNRIPAEFLRVKDLLGQRQDRGLSYGLAAENQDTLHFLRLGVGWFCLGRFSPDGGILGVSFLNSLRKKSIELSFHPCLQWVIRQ